MFGFGDYQREMISTLQKPCPTEEQPVAKHLAKQDARSSVVDPWYAHLKQAGRVQRGVHLGLTKDTSTYESFSNWEMLSKQPM